MDRLSHMQLFNLSLSEGYIMLDVRSEIDYCKKHITGSFSMPLTLTIKELENKYKKILEAYCPENSEPIIFIGYASDTRNMPFLLQAKFHFLDRCGSAFFCDWSNWPEFLTSGSGSGGVENISAEFESLEPYPSEILPNIYLGNRDNAFNERVVRNLKITHILSLNKGAHYDHGISHLNFPIDDDVDEDIIRAYNSVRTYLYEAYGNGKLLLHCDKGKSRSVAILILFLNEKLGLPFERLLDFVREQRRIAQPNPGFVDKVRAYIIEHEYGMRPFTPKSRAAHKLISNNYPKQICNFFKYY